VSVMRTHTTSIVHLARLVTLAAVASISLATSPAEARELVDPATLNPPPPDFFHASCEQLGRDIVCTLAFSDDPIVDEPLGLGCGGTDILFSQDRSVVGKRFYNADGDLVQRHFREYLSGTLTNPSTGKVLQWSQHDTVIHNLAVPGDLTTGSIQMTGAAIRVYSADGGTVIADAGRVLVDAASDTIVTSNGPHRFDDYFVRGNPDALAPVCAALS
jgi:hypothetical protein